MTLFERLMMALQSGRNFHVVMRTIFRKFDPAQPLDYGFETHAADPENLDHVSLNTVALLDCGHPFAGSIVQCICGRNFCLDCAAKIFKVCNRCGAPIAPCCSSHSHISGRDYCPEHKWSWLGGK